jgi:hypothetical protein
MIIPQEIEFVTDTATFVVFDLAALEHRMGDDADWWSLPAAELREVNDGRAAFINLGTDGAYRVESGVHEESAYSVHCHITCPSGRVFIGAGEEVISDGMEPQCLRGGVFLQVKTGNYKVSVGRTGPQRLILRLQPSERAENAFIKLLRV